MKAPRRLLIPLFVCAAITLTAQPPQNRGPGGELIRQGTQLDFEGKGEQARAIFQKAIDTAPDPAAKANAQRAMAMSWAFEGNCKKTADYEDKVIDYWKTQEGTQPDRAFYQQGEMANEAARVCIDNGDFDTAYDLYKKGRELGLREPNISPARKDLWDYRWEHAQARIAARRGNKAEAQKHVDAAKSLLADMKEKDAKLYEQQATFLPYLTGYVALYTGDYKAALEDLQKANQDDAFIQCLLGMTYEKLGDKGKAMDAYRKAAAVRGHNPPAAFAHVFTRKKLAET
jgi:tetratricopeptide (TPR) repeat protein